MLQERLSLYRSMYYLVYAGILGPVNGLGFVAESGTMFQSSSPTHTVHSPAIKQILS
jgi:hypothetical protein